MTETNTTYDREQVLQIISSVLEKVEPSSGNNANKMYNELKELQDIVHAARHSLDIADADEIKNEHISTANEELNEVVNATAEATSTIMDACERIEKHIDQMENESVGAIKDSITGIYEACSFQDITGQRIAKVTNSLGLIEDKVNALLSVFSEGEGRSSSPAHSRGEEATSDVPQSPSDEDLLNGPQTGGQGVSQDDIDSILAEFDDLSQQQ